MGVRTLGGGEVLEAWIPQLQERACWGHGLSVGLRGTRLSPGVRDICHLLLPQVNASAPRGFPFHSSDIQRDELVRRGRSGGEVRGWHPGCNLQSRSALDPGEPQRYSWSGLLSPQAPSGTGVSREALSGLLIMGAGGGSLIVLSLLLLRKKKPYGTISHGVVEVRGRHRGEGRS